MDYQPDYRQAPLPVVRFGYHATPELIKETQKMMMELAQPYDANLGNFLRSKGIPIMGEVFGHRMTLQPGIAWLEVEKDFQHDGTIYRWETIEEQKARIKRENNTKLKWREHFMGLFNHE